MKERKALGLLSGLFPSSYRDQAGEVEGGRQVNPDLKEPSPFRPRPCPCSRALGPAPNRSAPLQRGL